MLTANGWRKSPRNIFQIFTFLKLWGWFGVCNSILHIWTQNSVNSTLKPRMYCTAFWEANKTLGQGTKNQLQRKLAFTPHKALRQDLPAILISSAPSNPKAQCDQKRGPRQSATRSLRKHLFWGDTFYLYTERTSIKHPQVFIYNRFKSKWLAIFLSKIFQLSES